MVVDFQVIAQRRFQFGPGGETGLVDDLADAAIEAFDHAVGVRVTRRNQSMFDHQLLAQHVKDMLAARDTLAADRVFFLAGQTVGELAAVVTEQFDDGDRASVFQFEQEVGAAAVALVGIDFHEGLALGAVNGDEQVTVFGFVRPLRQVLDIHR